tara:strand:+ start:77 stop:949 length:873 start_codon:yes stop_codon:yes gene_type:complete
VTTINSIVGLAISLALATLVVFAGSDGGVSTSGLPLFAICAVLIFGVQWLCFVPSWLAHTERFFDLTGSATYVTVIVVALLASRSIDIRSLLLGIMVSLWATRLGSFLFVRVQTAGHDRRFEVMKFRFAWFLMTWTIQGLWILVTVSAALAAITADSHHPFGWIGVLGVVVWGTGFAVEVVADVQKRRFRRLPGNWDRFIRSGLWSWSQHPNYFGEILLWVGVAVVAVPTLSGWQYVTLTSPLFVWTLLTRVSGIPMLERAAERRWGGDPEFRRWRDSTPVLILRPPQRN